MRPREQRVNKTVGALLAALRRHDSQTQGDVCEDHSRDRSWVVRREAGEGLTPDAVDVLLRYHRVSWVTFGLWMDRALLHYGTLTRDAADALVVGCIPEREVDPRSWLPALPESQRADLRARAVAGIPAVRIPALCRVDLETACRAVCRWGPSARPDKAARFADCEIVQAVVDCGGIRPAARALRLPPSVVHRVVHRQPRDDADRRIESEAKPR